MNLERKFHFFLILFILIIFSILVTQKINLVTADLGRHIKNGELIFTHLDDIWEAKKVLKTNLYSYTYSEYPFLNHHWGSGVIFYLIWRVFGFIGISVFFTLISLLAFLIFFRVAWKNSNFETSFLLSIIMIPVIVSRVEIRPEVFSCLLSGLFLWILLEKKKWLWVLPALELLWVNLHVYFFLGLFLIGVFLLEKTFSLLKKGKFLSNLSDLGYLSKILFLSTFASLANPAGLKGFLYPFKIFEGYGYRLLENQSVWFLDKIVRYPPNLFFKIGFGVLLVSWIFVLARKKKVIISNLIFSLFFSYLALTAVRNFSLFGFFALVIAAGNLRGIGKIREIGEETKYFLISSLSVLLILVLFLVSSVYWMGKVKVGFGLNKGTEKGALFFLQENLHGPIFNNYDNGGYLIYYLFPKEKVFVDNRPEAYSKEFFENVYVPMQEQEEIWKKTDQKYNFNVIFFYRHDLTPWSQTFLVSRVADPSWAPVYVDDYSIIFLKRNKINESLIKRFELPKAMFSVR